MCPLILYADYKFASGPLLFSHKSKQLLNGLTEYKYDRNN